MTRVTSRAGCVGLVAFLALASPLRAVIRPVTDSTAYGRWYAAIREAAVDDAHVADVRGLVLQRNQGTLLFEDGRIQLLAPVEGRVWGAVFRGHGTLTLDPPIAVERAQMKRVYGAEKLERKFETAVLFFTDWTADELGQSVAWSSVAPPSDARDKAREAVEYVSDDDGWVARRLMVPLLDHGTGLFFAHLSGGGEPMAFVVDPYAFEEVSLWRPTKGKEKSLEPVVQFHQAADYASGSSLPEEALDLVVTDHYDIETTVAKNLELRGRATERIRVQAVNHPWVPFALHPDLHVDSVVWSDGRAAPFSRGEEGPDVWVDLSGAPATEAELTFHYHGEILDRPLGAWVVMKTTTDWFPAHRFGRMATYRMTFRMPTEYSMATVGSLVSADTTGDVVTRVYETPEVQLVTFNMGDFETTEIPGDAGPRISVQVSASAHERLRGYFYQQTGGTMFKRADMAGSVGSDLRTSFAFFNQAFGPTTVDQFIATEVPYAHGEAYPGLILLSEETYRLADLTGFEEMFRAHEVAHQWWGIGVRPATYHDRWLAEGFSEFSGIWYMARVRGSIDRYQERLDGSREELLDRRDDMPPVWLGTRAASSRHPDDFQTVVYEKGAWVLHMLRMLLMDFDGGGEDLFERIMHDFYSSYFGQAATTEAFQKTVEKHVGQSMQWFFDEWVYGSAIPTYRFSRKIQDQPDGTVKVTVRVRQEEVPDDFQMVVPILLDFGSKGTKVVKMLVMGPQTELELPLLPEKPDRVELNPFEAVLAETKTEGWKER